MEVIQFRWFGFAGRFEAHVLLSWFIFGGDKSALDKSQGLDSVDGAWQLGPDLYQQRIDSAHCTIQVRDLLLVGI